MDAVTNVPAPGNEPVLSYAPGSPERAALQQRLTELAGEPLELTMTIGDEQRMGGGERFDVVQPHRHAAVLGTAANATHADAEEAVVCAKAAAPAWRDLSLDDRAAVFLRAAELLSGPWRQTLNAATMLGQSKTAHQDRHDVDAAYARCLGVLMRGPGHPMVGSHDPRMVDLAQRLAAEYGRPPDSWEVQMLHGIRTDEQRRLTAEGLCVRTYVPYGADWYGYFMRRLAERPANLRFFLRSLVSTN